LQENAILPPLDQTRLTWVVIGLVRIALPEPKGIRKLRRGMYVQIPTENAAFTEALIVPHAELLSVDRQRRVFTPA
jgi:hypothetical protein